MHKIRLRLLQFITVLLLIQCTDDTPELEIEPISADFEASDTHIFAGESITFSDLSTGNPTQWQWIFEGGDPGLSEEKNPIVRYDSPGTYNVRLKAGNDNTEDILIIEEFIEVQKVGSFELEEQATFGLSIRSDFMQSMIILKDNSIVCTGWTNNENTNEQKTNILVTKFDEHLNLIWDALIEGSSADLVRQIISTKDGGFILSATTKSSDGDFPENKGEADIAIIKLNSSGSISWIKTYGGSAYDGINNNSLVELANGYAFAGYTASDDLDVSGHVGLYDIWLNELDLDGNIVNSVVIGSSENDYPYSLVKNSSGYTILSRIGASTADFSQSGISVFSIDLAGNVLWSTSFDAANAGKLIQTNDGGYAALSSMTSNVTDLLFSKFNILGNIEWQKTYPLPDQEFAEDLIQFGTEYIILGSSEPLTNMPRNGNAYVAKLNESGDVIQFIIFGDGKISAKQIVKVNDEKYIMGGTKNIAESYIDSEFFLQSLSDSF